ncbi:hypothetical protein Strain138_001517 [Pseudogemmatithrix spongiicola]|uniref:Uncharacterized protein n=1 Tax=Pseudogemmatithrix spongiicola TaxID=3062599 RepID=A0AA49JUI0_9BACT|nr:hypothetical protein Strain138_001517 [Gemmatimonadaceae bacterium 'strain 138']WKW15143.1 hypothetical protein Strain318_001517 [Gemmatimonadaceae bacterium 'strain 318']
MPKNRTLLMVSLLLVVASVATCRKRPRVITPHSKPIAVAGLPECPHDWRRSKREVTTFAGVGAHVPELNDCQRLVLGNEQDGYTYGDIAGVFVNKDGGTYTDASLSTPRALALVYFPYGGKYDPLHLTAELSCIWVQRTRQGYDAWVRAASEDHDCLDTATAANDKSLTLAVRATKPQAASRTLPDTLYNVVRWDWDPVTSTQFVSVRCGDSWCEIGQEGFGGSRSHVDGLPTAAIAFNALRVKGYYDEQYLAEWRNDRLVVGRNRGTIFPTAQLAAFAANKPTIGEWIPVAEINMAPEVGQYEHMLNLVGNSERLVAGPRAIVSLCLGDGRSCAPIKNEVILNESSCPPTEDGRWYARIERPGGARYFCVKHRSHPPGFYIPPVVRWRWREDDETIWIRCFGGCCEVDVDET